MHTHRSMIETLESRTLMSATVATADAGVGGAPATVVYATTTTTADPDEGGEFTGEPTTLARPLTYKLVYNRAS